MRKSYMIEDVISMVADFRVAQGLGMDLSRETMLGQQTIMF